MSSNWSKSSFRSDSPIQLRQKVIHYRAEVSRFQNMIDEYEKKFKSNLKELEILKENLKSIQNIEPEIQRIEPEPETNEMDRTEVQPYFSYSIILPDKTEEYQNIMVIGNFVFKNTGNVPLNTPIICLSVEPSDACSLSGKIKLAPLGESDESDRIYDDSAKEEWVYVHENWRKKIKESGEYWLRPIHQTVIAPRKQLSFSNFNLNIAPNSKYNSVKIHGYVYFEELPNGVSSLNSIIINY